MCGCSSAFDGKHSCGGNCAQCRNLMDSFDGGTMRGSHPENAQDDVFERDPVLAVLSSFNGNSSEFEFATGNEPNQKKKISFDDILTKVDKVSGTAGNVTNTIGNALGMFNSFKKGGNANQQVVNQGPQVAPSIGQPTQKQDGIPMALKVGLGILGVGIIVVVLVVVLKRKGK